MALSRIGSSVDLINLFTRSAYAVSALSPRHGRQNVDQLHVTVVRRYPEAPRIPLPTNVSEIFNIETSQFAQERARDLSTPLFFCGSNSIGNNANYNSYGFADSVKIQQLDSRTQSYDCFGSISLNGSMQTNVPKPFCSSGRSTYLNMPGGMWSRDGKYLAEIMRKSHFKVYQIRQIKRSGGFDDLLNKRRPVANDPVARSYSTTVDTKTQSKMSAEKPIGENKDGEGEKTKVKDLLTKREQFEMLVKDYGKTIIIFHTVISLISLGLCYTIVSSGIDFVPVLQFIIDGLPVNVGKDELINKVMSGSSTFLISYAVHKIFAPIRLTLTIAATPTFVKFLRRKGIIKPPAKIKAAIEAERTNSHR